MPAGMMKSQNQRMKSTKTDKYFMRVLKNNEDNIYGNITAQPATGTLTSLWVVIHRHLFSARAVHIIS